MLRRSEFLRRVRKAAEAHAQARQEYGRSACANKAAERFGLVLSVDAPQQPNLVVRLIEDISCCGTLNGPLKLEMLIQIEEAFEWFENESLVREVDKTSESFT